MRRLTPLLLPLLLACGAPPRSAATLPPRPSNTASSERSTRAELPGFGFSAEFPCLPAASTRDDQWALVQMSCSTSEEDGLWSIASRGKDRARDADSGALGSGWTEASYQRCRSTVTTLPSFFSKLVERSRCLSP